MPALYQIHASAKATRTLPNTLEWTRQFPVPTFFLHEDIHGIRDAAHAEDIARRMLLDLLCLADPGARCEAFTTAIRLDAADISAGLTA